jgi:hypothetical protein
LRYACGDPTSSSRLLFSSSELPIEDVLATSLPWCAVWAAELKQLFAVYVEAKQRQNVLDYDDLLLYWAQMVSDPGLAGEIGERFDHVLVDEYQDTNRLQASILLALKPGGRGLTVVGDDAQSIYSFRAATVRNILDFPGRFSPPAAIITLDRNYRSTQPILAAANRVIDLASERFTKNLWTDRTAALLPLYRAMVRTRLFDAKAITLQREAPRTRFGAVWSQMQGSPRCRATQRAALGRADDSVEKAQRVESAAIAAKFSKRALFDDVERDCAEIAHSVENSDHNRGLTARERRDAEGKPRVIFVMGHPDDWNRCALRRDLGNVTAHRMEPASIIPQLLRSLGPL